MKDKIKLIIALCEYIVIGSLLLASWLLLIIQILVWIKGN